MGLGCVIPGPSISLPLTKTRLPPPLNEHLFLSLASARRIIEAWRIDYNNVRPHSSLGGLAPAEFTNRPRQGHVSNEAKLSAA